MSSALQQTPRDFGHVPDYLKDAPRWLLWKRQQRPMAKKPTKVPYYVNGRPRTKLDSTADVAQLVTFAEAERVLQQQPGRYAGLGFALGGDGKGGYWQGIDLDGLSSHPELAALIEHLPGYVEYSPSGDGVHVMGYGESFATMGSNGSGVEAYCRGRFFTFTGNTISAGPLQDLTPHLSRFGDHRWKHLEAANEPVSKSDESWASACDITPEMAKELRSALAYLDHDDRGVWVAVAHALKGAGTAGFEIWREWSARSHLYEAGDAKRVWKSIRDPHSGAGAVFKHAELAGWINPRKVRSEGISGFASAANDEKFHRDFEFVSAGDLIGNLAPPKYLVEGYIEQGSLSLLFGEPGTCKSFLALDWCSSIVTGAKWNGCTVQQAPVFYIAGEGHSGLGRRLMAWQLHYGHELSQAPLYLSKTAAALMEVSSAQDVHLAVNRLAEQHGKPAMVVIDTLHRNLGPGDENSAGDIAAFLHHVDEYIRKSFDCAVLIVHHSGHGDKARARGSSAIQGAMDSVYSLSNLNGLLKLSCSKQKDGESPQESYFSKKVVDLGFSADCVDDMTSLVLAQATSDQIRGAMREKTSSIVGLLVALVEEEGQVPPPTVSREHSEVKLVVTIDRLRQRYVDARKGDAIKPESAKRAFSREFKDLAGKGLVMASGQFVWPAP